MTQPRARGPLDGLRIVEFSAFVAAPSAGLALAQLGAEVIRVDPPGGNIDANRMPVNAEGCSLYWASLNHGKRSVEIDPRAPAGRRLLQGLIAAPGEGGGIFVTNLGVDGVATAVLAADRHRRRTGEGQLVRLALSDVAFAATASLGYMADVEVNGTARRADGNFLYGAYGDAFCTVDDRWAMVVAISDRQWHALVSAVGLSDALVAAAASLGYRLDTEAGRWEARELISAFLRPWFARRTLAEVGAALSDRALLWGPYRSFEQMLAEDARVSEVNPMFARIDHPGYGRFLTATSPLDFGATPRTAPAPAARIGADTAAVLAEVLGFDAAAILALQAAGTLGGPPAGALAASPVAPDTPS
jgi:crotonobetainyl-CoA:carnitine CoA-transferase CaiB-like acyl-CoA transferase